MSSEGAGAETEKAPEGTRMGERPSTWNTIMQTRQVQKKSQPAGRPPKGMMWNSDTGKWIPDPSAPETTHDAVLYPWPPGRAPKGKVWDTTTGEWIKPGEVTTGADDDPPAEPPAKRPAQSRKFQPSWVSILPWLVFSLGVGVTVPGLASTAATGGDDGASPGEFICPTAGSSGATNTA